MKIGFIGLGMMGGGMAANLQQGGHQLTVNDLNAEAASEFLANGASWAETPRVVAESCSLVFTSLPTPADVQTVGFGSQGLAAGFRNGAVWFDLSTNALDGRDSHSLMLLQWERAGLAPVTIPLEQVRAVEHGG